MTRQHPAGPDSRGSMAKPWPTTMNAAVPYTAAVGSTVPDSAPPNSAEVGPTSPSFVAGGAPDDPHDTVRACRVRLSRIIEPSDTVGMILLAALGPETLWRSVVELQAPTPALRLLYRKALDELLPGTRAPELGKRFAAWRSRLPVPEPRVDARHAEQVGAWTLIPEDPDWPVQLDDLGPQRPIVLWGRGDRSVLGRLERSVAVVGARNASGYGAAVTRQMVHELAAANWCVVSGGAYGIDAVAHMAALEAGTGNGATIAVLACGVDRFYPAGNADLLRHITHRGVVLSEVPLGCAPTRYRFLQRNRIIAALTRATVVTEAAWRSGSLNTARHAAGLSREVAAVPGDVLVGGSAGCHRLIRDDYAVLVSNAAELLELVEPLGNAAAQEAHRAASARDERPEDGLDPTLLRLFDALPLRSDADPSHLCAVSGLSPGEVLTGLVKLREAGLAADSLLGWRRVGSPHGRSTGRGSRRGT